MHHLGVVLRDARLGGVQFRQGRLQFGLDILELLTGFLQLLVSFARLDLLIFRGLKTGFGVLQALLRVLELLQQRLQLVGLARGSCGGCGSDIGRGGVGGYR